ncbi:ribonuclease Z [Ranunculus cassubicifolius]
MDSSRRAVEAYWRSRLIEAATSDEDKVAPVYKLEEICELLRSSHVSIVKEVSEFIFKRLNHKSPIVKQKALSLIKYCVGKSGVEFRREMQRHSSVVRQLFHYKGQVDPLKGDALNKAVRDTSHEAITAIFASEDDKTSPAEDINRRIEGFGNTNYVAPAEDKKSFLSEVVDIGSASLKLGLSSITAAQSSRKSDSGSYKGPVLRRSLTTETETPDRYERFDSHSETRGASATSKNVAGGTWGQDSRVNAVEMTNGESSSSHAKSREERLLETIVTPGGVRLQPSRDALQVFLVEAAKLDAVSLSRALELKLQSHLWQVRVKAVCVLEAILRKKDETHFAIIASFFTENIDAIVKCSESPQASLREKAIKVLSILDGDQTSGTKNYSANTSSVNKPDTSTAVQMPDLIDTGDSDEFFVTESDPTTNTTSSSTRPMIDDLFGESPVTEIPANGHTTNEEDPFADVSFYSNGDSNNSKPQLDDIFSGLTVDEKQPVNTTNSQQVLDIFGPSFDTNISGVPSNEKEGLFSDALQGPTSNSTNTGLNDIFSSQMMGINQNATFPVGAMQYGMPQNMMFNQGIGTQPINYGAMGNFLAQQQQLLASMSNFQPVGNFGVQPSFGVNHFTGNTEGALPDIFNPSIPVQNSTTMMNNTKKEDTKAFDFISEHLSTKRVI